MLPAADLPGVGRGALEKLAAAAGAGAGAGAGADAGAGAGGNRLGTDCTCADITAAPLAMLQRALGPRSGAALRDAARGVGPGRYRSSRHPTHCHPSYIELDGIL